MIWSIASFFLGVLLGQRLTVFSLIPVICLLDVVILIVGVARADDFFSIAVAGLCATLAVQMGYLIGTLIRSAIIAISQTQRPSEHASILGRNSASVG